MPNHPLAYRFGEYTLEPGEHRLLRADDEVTLRPKAFETLLFLVSRHGHTVPKNELLDAVWPGTFVSEAVLTHCIVEVRQALQDNPKTPRYVRTLSKIGYAFVAPVETSAPTPPAAAFLKAVPSIPPATSVAVLPFANLSADPDNVYLCDGLSEELINGLAKVPELKVVAHSSSFAFKGRDTDVREIGRQLGVGSILEGSVRKSGDRLRISAQLIDSAGGFHVWCEQYDRPLRDVFVLQEEIAQAVLAALKVELFKSGRAPTIRPSTSSMDAYLLYLQGRSFWHRRFAGQLQKAMDCFERAIQQDPAFALAYCGLADSFATLGVWAFRPPDEVLPRAKALTQRALERDPSLGEAHASMGLLHLFSDWDWAGAERELARAIELNPGSALTRLWAGHFLSIVGRHDEAVAEVVHAKALDPLSPIVRANVGWTIHLARQHDRALEELRRADADSPGNPMIQLYLGFALVASERLPDALDYFKKSAAAPGGMPWAAETVGFAHGLMGDRASARRVLETSLARMAHSYVPSSAIASIYLGMGDDEGLFEWLDRCLRERDVLMPWLGSMPAFDRVRRDSRFQSILARIGLA